jgi:Flp pilus assembly protein TadG
MGGAMRMIMTATRMRLFKLRFADLWRNCRAVAATEFAVIAPVMLGAFFGTVEFCSAVAVDRKVTLMARTLSDLTSQNANVTDLQLTNFFAAATAIMTPYSATPVQSTITEIWVNSSLQARVQWSTGINPHTAGTTLTIPLALQVKNTYLIFGEVKYQYMPSVGYVMGTAGINLSDVSYTRPRQSTCVLYNAADSSVPCPTL